MIIKEGKIEIEIPTYKKICKKMPVFYNPIKTFDRSVSVIFLKTFRRMVKKRLSVADLLAASGIRGLRFATEVNGLKEVFLNDINTSAFKTIIKNVLRNNEKLRCAIKISNMDANFFLFSERKFFDYIDLDPFGSPVPFLDACVRFIKRNGILAVTATDTAALCGSKREACLRKYGANVKKLEFYPELGIRVLAQAVIKQAARYEIALNPVFCHATKHYYRIYFKQDIGANRTDEKLREIGLLNGNGPLWLGSIFDEKFIENMCEEAKKTGDFNLIKFLETIKEETKIKVPFYFTTKQFRLKKEPRLNDLINQLNESGFKAARTHFDPKGFRTNANFEEIKETITKLNKNKA
jgi:tRNA (guanine26-N2/guanine27-N2)-dimethyltransferase